MTEVFIVCQVHLQQGYRSKDHLTEEVNAHCDETTSQITRFDEKITKFFCSCLANCARSVRRLDSGSLVLAVVSYWAKSQHNRNVFVAAIAHVKQKQEHNCALQKSEECISTACTKESPDFQELDNGRSARGRTAPLTRWALNCLKG